MAPPEERSPEVQEILGELDAMYEDALAATHGRDDLINENMAFYRGLQWGVSMLGGWMAEPDDTGEAREVQNYIRPTVRSAVASMLRNMPSPEAVAMQSDHDAIARAMAVQHLSRSILQNGTIPIEVLYRGETEAAVKGAVWYKVYYDPNFGRVTRFFKGFDPSTAQPIIGEMFEGGVRVEFRDIVDVLPDPHANCEEEVRHLFDRKLVPLSTLEDHFPVDVFGVDTKGRWTNGRRDPGRDNRDLVENPARALGTAYTRNGRSPRNELCELIEFWERPTRANPKGRLIVYSGSVVVVDGPLPYEWPWVLRNGQNIIPNSLYADGVVTDLKPIQRTINVTASRRLEWIRYASAPSLMVHRDSRVNVDHITDIAGDLVVFEGTFEPKWSQPPSIPQSMFETESVLVSVLKDVSTYSDISRGDAPAGVETGRALAYLHEFSQGVREPDVQMFKLAIVRIVKKCVTLIRDFYPENRMIRMLGENNKWLDVPFRRGDYNLDADIMIEIDSGAPNSRALRLAEASQIFQLGGFDDTPQAEKFRKVINYDFQDRNTIDPRDKHRSRARGEIQKLVADPMYMLEARWEDDHEVYLEVLEDFMAGQEYEDLPPIAKSAFEQYFADHELWIAQQQENLAAQQAMMSPNAGAPAEKKQMASPFDGGKSDVEAAAMPGANPDVAPESLSQSAAA